MGITVIMTKCQFEEIIHVRDIARSWEEKKGRKRKRKRKKKEFCGGCFCTPGGLGICVAPLKVAKNKCRKKLYKSNKPPPVGEA